jgi:hypothetical protein
MNKALLGMVTARTIQGIKNIFFGEELFEK